MEPEGSYYLMAWYWRSRIFRGKPGNTSVKCEANSPWKRRYNKAMQVIQSNNTQVKWLPREKSWWPAVEQNSTKVALNETREPLFTNASIRDRPEDSKRMLETISKKLAVCWKSEGYQKTAPSKIFAGQIWQPLTTQKEIAIERNSDRNTTITPLTTAFWL